MKDPTTYSTVEKDKDGHYTRRALLYQDILKFAVFVKNGSSFKDRELARWVLDNNEHYFNYYRNPYTKKTKDANRVDYILYDGVKDKLDDFISLGLLETDTAPAEKGLGDVRVCRCTSDGELLAWIIESIKPDKRQKAYEKAYDIIQTKLNVDTQSSAGVFHSALYKKYRQRGRFGEFVIDPLRDSLETVPSARNMRQLQYASLVIAPTDDADSNMIRFSLWEETFSEMKPNVQDLLFYNIKIDIEQRMMYRCRYPKLYEDARYNRRTDIMEVVLEAYCANCSITHCVYMNLIEYLRRTNLGPKDPINRECPVCNNNSLAVQVL